MPDVMKSDSPLRLSAILEPESSTTKVLFGNTLSTAFRLRPQRSGLRVGYGWISWGFVIGMFYGVVLASIGFFVLPWVSAHNRVVVLRGWDLCFYVLL